tara:strand:+ start:249 stop:782 length:534 start_codon:yes stop_codon:yes gene_type:complete
MKLISEVPLQAPYTPWTLADRFTALRSCFADEIGQRLALLLFSSTTNQFGTLYSPISLSRTITRALDQNLFRENDFFPAYEILNDELRDYRFYSEDLAHPNALAIDYIWEKFSSNYFRVNTLSLCQEITSLRAAFKHRPLNPDTSEHQAFRASINTRRKALAALGLDTTSLDNQRLT